MDFRHLEQKWQLEWRQKKIFDTDPKGPKNRKFYIVVAFPYPSGGMHVGHVRTYTVPDVIARFKRMQGYNVLFPMAWHVTGTPIVGALKRLREKEKKQIYVLKNVFRMRDKELKKIKTPMDFADYFIEKHYKAAMMGLGFSIDWRMEFTTHSKHYNKFIEWQYHALKEKNLVKKGKHPVRYCLTCQNPVTTHDLLEGEDADINKLVLIKFRIRALEFKPTAEKTKTVKPRSAKATKNKKTKKQAGKIKPVYLVTATLRPETVYGVTNIWLNHGSELVLAEVKINNRPAQSGKSRNSFSELWIISEFAVEKLRNQGKKIKIIKKIKAENIIGKYAENLVLGNSILVLPASFVDPEHATGIVMSVPAHAPYDYVALKEMDRKILEHYKINPEEVKQIKPIKVVNVHGADVAEEIEKNKIIHQGDKRLEEITKEIYKKEFHHGKLNEKCGLYRGKKVSEVKEILIKDFTKKGFFYQIYDFNKKVVCRDGGKVIVAEKDSWFLDYGNQKWKSLASKMLKKMKIIPDYARAEYNTALEWIEDWPAIRNFGLGTSLPWDKRFIIEPLSDSTIYMAFYTIAHLAKKYRPESLKKELFDFVFLGEGNVKKVSRTTRIKEKDIKEMKKSFDYWYPLDWNFSAHELIKNHMTFFIFHHTMLFPEKYWPKGEASWGVGLLEGGKMSSSRGNVLLATDALEHYGADTIRLFLMSSVEPWQDFDWRVSEVENYKKKIDWFHNKVINLYGSGEGGHEDLTNVDRWFFTKLQEVIKDTTSALEGFQTRKASLKSFFEMSECIKWYERRGKINKIVMNQVMEDWVKLLAPFMPHTCEELWERMGKKPFVFQSGYPVYNQKLTDYKAVYLENMLKNTLEDIESVIKITGITEPKKIILYVPETWKYDLFYVLQEQMEYIQDRGKILKSLMESEEFKKHSQQIMRMLPSVMKNPERLETVLDQSTEFNFLMENKDFLEKEFKCGFEVVRAQESRSEKSVKAEPGKPGIELV